MKVLILRLVAGGVERSELGTWAAMEAHDAMKLPFVEDVGHLALDLCPTPVARNRAVQMARDNHYDVLVSIDADTLPARGFLRAALEELKAGGPKVVVAPYVCAGPEQRVQIFRWSTNEDVTGGDALGRFVHVSRDEASRLTGREEVACAGTGAFACHLAAFDRIAPPYFDYEYVDTARTKVASTEDVRCFRDLSLAGVPIVCLWDFWATHFKIVPLGRPLALTPGEIAERHRRFLLAEPSLPPLKSDPIVVDAPPSADAKAIEALATMLGCSRGEVVREVERLCTWDRVILDKPEDRLYHAADRTWWRRDGDHLVKADSPLETTREDTPAKQNRTAAPRAKVGDS